MRGNRLFTLPLSGLGPRGHMLRLLVVSIASMQLAGCGDVRLPRPVAPDKKLPEPPELPTEPVAEGFGRLILDANGEKARVVEVAGATVQNQGYTFNLIAQRAVCASTPCVVDVPRGPHRLVFTSQAEADRGGVAEIDVGGRTKVVRHAMGERIEHAGLKTGSSLALTFGLIGAIVGGSVLVAGAVDSGTNNGTADASRRSSGLTSVGGAVLGISAGVMALGVTLGILGRTEVREGSTTEWTLEPSGQGPLRERRDTTTTHVRLAPSRPGDVGGLGLAF